MIIFFLVAVVFALYWFYGDYVTLEWLKHHRNTLKHYVNKNYVVSAIAFILFYALYTAFTLPGALVFTLAAGFLFATLPALLYVNIAATLGGALSFLASRYVIGKYVQKKYASQLHTINENLKQYGMYYLLLARLIFIFPFFMVNLLIGLTKIPLWQFIWTTSVGIIPGSLLYILAGRQLSTLESIHDIVSWRFFILLLVLIILLVSPLMYKIVRRKKA